MISKCLNLLFTLEWTTELLSVRYIGSSELFNGDYFQAQFQCVSSCFSIDLSITATALESKVHVSLNNLTVTDDAHSSAEDLGCSPLWVLLLSP